MPRAGGENGCGDIAVSRWLIGPFGVLRGAVWGVRGDCVGGVWAFADGYLGTGSGVGDVQRRTVHEVASGGTEIGGQVGVGGRVGDVGQRGGAHSVY